MKVCSVCKVEKPFEDFHRKTNRPDGYQTVCKVCAARARKQWGRDNPDRRAEHRRYTTYRIRPDEYKAMLEKQYGLCAMCQCVLGKKGVIDHNHTTGAVRGILCRRCNLALGYFETSDLLEQAKAYLDW